MAGEWKLTSLRDAGVSLIDCDHRTPPAAEFGYPYIAIPQLKEGRLNLSGVRRISSEHFVEWTRKAKPQHHDVVLSRRCNPGETAYVPLGLECALGQNLVLLRSDGSRVFPPFLRWLVRGPDWWEQIGTFINVGAVFDSLKCADIPNFKMPLPPIAEQKAIAAVLGALDDKIELNRRMNATLEAMARALFQSWFVDFDPVRAKPAGRKTDGSEGPTAALFSSALQDSPLGKIPMGWQVLPFSDAFKIPLRNGLTRPKCVRGAGIPMVNMGELFAHRRIGNIPMDRVPLSDSEFDLNLVEAGDLLFARQSLTLAGAGQCSIAIEADEPRTYESHLIRCRLDTTKSSPWFFYYYFLSSAGHARIVSIVEQVAAAGIRGSDLARMAVLMPPVGLQHRFAEIIAPFERRIAANNDETRTLAALRDTLLPQLLSGELPIASCAKS